MKRGELYLVSLASKNEVKKQILDSTNVWVLFG